MIQHFQKNEVMTQKNIKNLLKSLQPSPINLQALNHEIENNLRVCAIGLQSLQNSQNTI